MNENYKATAIDPLTRETFNKRRNNQVFANRQNHIRYNNLKAYEKRSAKAQIDKILERNKQVLKGTLGSNTEIIKSLDYLQGAGLHFGCNTHTIMIEGHKWICIYDYAYSLIDINAFKIIKL